MKTVRLLRSDYTRFMTNRDGARHEIKKSSFDLHGPVRLASPGGRFIAIVRTDPGDAPDTDAVATSEHVSADTMEAQSESMKRMKNSGLVGHAPSPKTCKCALWPWEDRELDEKQKPKRHHPKCALGKMWERQKGGKITAVPGGPTLEARIHRGTKPSDVSKEKPLLMGKPSKATMKLKGEKVQKIPHPDSCKCSVYTKSKRMEQDQHHPTCEYFKKYKALSLARASAGMPAPTPDEKVIKLFDLESQAIVRDAEHDEIEEARVRLRDEGIALCEVDERQYLVCYEDGTTLEPAAGEPVATEETQVSDTEPPPAGEEVLSPES